MQSASACPRSLDTAQFLLCRRWIPVTIVGTFEQKTTWDGVRREMRRLIRCKATMGHKGILSSISVVNTPNKESHVPLITRALCCTACFP